MDNITAVINRKVWNFIEDASEQACAEYGVNEKEVWSDGKRFGYLQEFRRLSSGTVPTGASDSRRLTT